MEQELSALKSTCASLQSEVATQQALVASCSDAADASAARAHTSLTHNMALKKKMKEELPRLVDAVAKAQGERDAAVRQMQTEAANHSVECNMMSSKLAGDTALVLLLPLHVTACCSVLVADEPSCLTRRHSAATVRVRCTQA